MGRYWCDANVFIWGSKVPYPFERSRGYWNWFGRQLDAGVIVSHVRVYNEVIKGASDKEPDPIIAWVKGRKAKGLAIPSGQEHQELVGKICTYSFKNFGAIKGQSFIKGADPYLIAHASLDGGTLVTQENKNKLDRIPTVCSAFGVRYINLFEMNNELKAEMGL